MSNEYQLGKDIAAIQDSLRRLEASISVGQHCKCSSKPPEFEISQESIPPFADMQLAADEHSSIADINITWNGIDEQRTGKIGAPDGMAEFIYFAFAVKQPVSYDKAFGAFVLDHAKNLSSQNKSCDPSFYYRPVNRKDNAFVLGVYKSSHKTFGWIVVEPDHTWPDGSCCICFYWDHTGKRHSPKNGWDPDFYFHDDKYLVRIRFCQAGRDYGLGIGFGPITQR